MHVHDTKWKFWSFFYIEFWLQNAWIGSQEFCSKHVIFKSLLSSALIVTSEHDELVTHVISASVLTKLRNKSSQLFSDIQVFAKSF